MKKIRKLSLLLGLALALCLGGCSNSNQAPQGQVEENTDQRQVASEEKEETSLSESNGLEKTGQVDLEYANHFNIEYYNDIYKLIEDSEGEKYLLIPEGEDVPKDTLGAEPIQMPIESLGTTNTIQQSWIRPIGEIEKISTVTYDKDRWYIEEIIQGLESGQITYVGDNKAPDYELISAIDPDLTLMSSSNIEEMGMMYDELGLSYMAFDPHEEEDFRGRIEWIKFTGALFDKEEEAQEFYEEEMARLEEVSNSIDPDEEKPKVSSFYFLESKDIFNVKNAGDYQVDMIEWAGGDYIPADLNPEERGNTNMNAEEVYLAIEDADIILFDSVTSKSVQSLESLVSKGEYLADLKAVENKNVWGLKPTYFQEAEQLASIVEEMNQIFTNSHDKNFVETDHFFRFPDQ